MPKIKVGQVKTPLAKKLGDIKPKQRSEPLWKGPEDSSNMGGITQGLMQQFLGCRERFRLRVIEGLQPIEGFNKSLEFGQMWHTCEESLAAPNPDFVIAKGQMPLSIHNKLKNYCVGLCKKYPLQQEEIEKWFNVCKVQFPIYMDYWEKHPDNLKRTPLMQEQVFQVPYTLPSGRVVYLRGKFDAVDLIGSGKTAGIYLQENKTKGDINVERLQRQLTFDLQTMVYLTALQLYFETPPGLGDFRSSQVKGVRYNVIRRPLSGGRGSIVRHKGTANKPEETYESYYSRLSAIIKEDCESDDPSRNQYWFSRWKVEVSQQDIESFKTQFLNPFLESVCLWYEFVTALPNPWEVRKKYGEHNPTNCLHYRMPYGTYSSLTDGNGESEMDMYLESGSEVGLTRDGTLFRELQ